MASTKPAFNRRARRCIKSGDNILGPTQEKVQCRVYLDHAATSWPKHPGVLEAAINYQTHIGATVGRGNYKSGIESAAILARARQRVAEYLGASVDEVAFTSNGTMGLNAAIFGLVKPGDYVVTTAIEHNSVLRPLMRLQEDGGVAVSIAECDSAGWVDPEHIAELCSERTKWICISHASNVTGRIQDIDNVVRFAKEQGIEVLLDACQTAGYLPMPSGVGAIVCSGHKGLGGVLGTGVLILRSRLHAHFRSPWIGGTGSSSHALSADFGWQESVESGNKNVFALAALQQAVSQRIESSPGCMHQLTQTLFDILDASPVVDRIGKEHNRAESTLAIASCLPTNMSPQDLALVLDSEFGIEARAGYHCAGRIHDYLNTTQNGTIRFSLGSTSSKGDLEHLKQSLQMLE